MSMIGELPTTLATWVYLVYDRGVRPSDPAVLEACEALAGGKGAPEKLGAQLSEAIAAGLPGDDAGQVLTYLQDLFGGDRLDLAVGRDREERLRSARRYQFGRQMPWLAHIVDRFPDGTVRPHWVLVEQVSDVVRLMDPYPWDDVDEEYDSPITDFLVKWELAGGEGIRLA